MLQLGEESWNQVSRQCARVFDADYSTKREKEDYVSVKIEDEFLFNRETEEKVLQEGTPSTTAHDTGHERTHNPSINDSRPWLQVRGAQQTDRQCEDPVCCDNFGTRAGHSGQDVRRRFTGKDNVDDQLEHSQKEVNVTTHTRCNNFGLKVIKKGSVETPPP